MKNQEMTYMQADCLLKYSQRTKQSLKDCSIIFQKYHIFDYISVCYDYLHLSGIEYVVEDISERIQVGKDFVAEYAE